MVNSCAQRIGILIEYFVAGSFCRGTRPYQEAILQLSPREAMMTGAVGKGLIPMATTEE